MEEGGGQTSGFVRLPHHSPRMPTQLLMGRRPRNKLPAKRSLLVPKPYSFHEVKRHFDMEKTKQKFYHDRVSQERPPFQGRQVRMEPRTFLVLGNLPGTRKWVPGEMVQNTCPLGPTCSKQETVCSAGIANISDLQTSWSTTLAVCKSQRWETQTMMNTMILPPLLRPTMFLFCPPLLCWMNSSMSLFLLLFAQAML